MSQNKKSFYKVRNRRNKFWIFSFFLLIWSSTALPSQDLLQASTELSKLLQSRSFTPTLQFFNPNYEIHLNGSPIGPIPDRPFPITQTGIYTVHFYDLPGNIGATALLSLGEKQDTIRTSESIVIFNQAGYVNWEAIGPTDTLRLTNQPKIECNNCRTQTNQVSPTNKIQEIYPKGGGGDSVIVDGQAFYIKAGERLILSPTQRVLLAQIRGQRNQLSKPTQQLLEMWYRFVAYKDPNWQNMSLADLREELYENPFLPNEIANLVPNSSIKVSSYLPPPKRPQIPDWQRRLHQTKQAYNVSLQPELQYDKLNEPVMSAHQVAAQQAEKVYAADDRLGLQLNPDNLLRGLASFIEERAQEELNVVFLNRMRKKLSNDSLLLTLFPNTAMLFDQFELDNYRFIMENAQTVFTTDLSNLGLNVYNVFELEELNKEFKYSSELYFAALVLKMINMVYLDVPTDTILINSYLSLENQADLLELELRNKTAQAILQDSVFQEDLLEHYGQYSATLTKGAADLLVQVTLLDSIINELKEEVPYTHPLYQRIFELDDGVNNLISQIQNWSGYFEEVTALRKNQLLGQPSKEYILSHSELKNYNRFFPSGSDAPQERVSKGLYQLNRELKGQEGLHLTDWRSNAQYLSEEILNLKIKWSTIQEAQVSKRTLRTFLAYQVLQEALQTELVWWANTPATQKPLLALEFLDSTLHQDPKISLAYKSLRLATLGDQTDYEDVKPYLATLEQALLDSYWPLLGQYTQELRQEKTSKSAPLVSQNGALFKTALTGFEQLFNEKQQSATTDPDAFEDVLDSLQAFFPQLSLKKITGGQHQAFSNPFVPILDSILRYSHLQNDRLRAQFTQIDASLDSLNQPVFRAQIAQNEMLKQLSNFQSNQPDSILLKSSNRIRGLSKVFAVSTHLVQALKSESFVYQTTTVNDTLRFRNTSEKGSINNSVVNISDSLSIQKVIRQDTVHQKWLSLDQLNQVFQKDSLSRALFFGLLYEDILHIPDLQLGKKGSRVQAEQIATLGTSILRGVQELYQLEDRRKNLKAKGDKMSLADYSSIIFETLNIVDKGFKLFKDQGNQTVQEKQLLEAGSQILNQSNQLYQNLVNKQYNMVIANLAALIQAMVTDNNSKGLQREADLFKSKLLTYGSFMAAVALAQTPDQVKTALETASVEVGYSRVKRVNKFNISLNAYLGMGLGFEQADGYQSSAQINLATPVGLTISRSIGKGNSLSLFGSILDLGPIVTYDFSTKATYTDAKLRFEDFVAPGAFVFWNIANTPFTFGAGMQRTPKIRVLGDNPDPQRTTRILGSFLIDVPIFNLFTQKN